jgi:hypothetical protein
MLMIILEVNTKKTKYMLMSRRQNAGQSNNKQTVNRSFENVAKFKHFRTGETIQNLVQDEIKSKFNSSYACHHSVQYLLTSRLLPKKIKN